jgi:phytoene dehydrogenase-like protein
VRPTADAVVVGSGPNGLAAAITLARAGLAVEVYEGATEPGGGCQTAELTLPGFHHDVCSTVHPLLASSPFFQLLNLPALGIHLRTPEVAFAHPLDGGRAGAVHGSVAQTAATLGVDGEAYRHLLEPLVAGADGVVGAALSPVRPAAAIRAWRHPTAVTRFAGHGMGSVERLARRYATDEAAALFAGVGAHAMLPLDAPLTGGFALLLAVLAHQVGWPVIEGGSGAITSGLMAELTSLGGQVHTGRWIRALDDLPAAPLVLLDVTPRQFLDLGGAGLPARYRRALRRFRYGPGIFKIDWAIAGAMPWTAEACRRAATVHVGGTLAEIARAEADVAAGRHAEHPFVIVVQPGVVDATRAPSGSQTLWAYCHVPAGSTLDVTAAIEAQIERFAPGFTELILARVSTDAVAAEAHNLNYVGGDINAGAAGIRQTIVGPTWAWDPYRTPIDGLYLCSASTPPGGGVHGMCGVGAARSALRYLARRSPNRRGH